MLLSILLLSCCFLTIMEHPLSSGRGYREVATYVVSELEQAIEDLERQAERLRRQRDIASPCSAVRGEAIRELCRVRVELWALRQRLVRMPMAA
jgi:hypothetical protein